MKKRFNILRISGLVLKIFHAEFYLNKMRCRAMFQLPHSKVRFMAGGQRSHVQNSCPFHIMGGSIGGTGSGPPLENHENIGFLSNTGFGSLKNHKTSKPAFNFGPL